MNISLTATEIKQLSGFIGYGPNNPKIIFLGTEEAGGGLKNIQTRLTKFTSPTQDLYKAHCLLEDFGETPNPLIRKHCPVQQWTTASFFTLALAGKSPQEYNNYCKNYLGRQNRESFLMDCFPVPKPSQGTQIQGYKPKQAWEDFRRDNLKNFISAISPQPIFIIAYGNTAGDKIEELVGSINWENISETDCSVGKIESGTVICKTGFFGQGRFNRDYIRHLAPKMQKLANQSFSINYP